MIKQKTIILPSKPGGDGDNNPSYTLQQMQTLVNETADVMLAELNTEEHAFISLQFSHMPECSRHMDRVFVTIVYREIPTRQVLVEKRQ